MSGPVQAIRVLAVDDEPSICELVRTMLEPVGYEVTTVTDPKAAANLVRTGGFHLVLLDMMMPHQDGIETLKQIRDADGDVAVVVLTGYPSLETAVLAMKLEAMDYLQKPFKLDELRETVAGVLKKKGVSRTPEEQLHRAIGETIRNLRKERALTLKHLATRTGLSVSLLSQIERAESSASISSLYKIAVALDARVQDLFGDF